ncbi:MAG TPA: cation:proton antiporter [Draconibacterium sp.]|nr:cation:proton antiporter [Draconibacterium sp.]
MLFLNIFNFALPFTEPVIIIALVLLILLIGPVFFERIRIPSIVGLLLSGAIIGPHGFNLIPSDLEFTLFGTIGLLYLMFLAGLEIDLIDFIENKSKSIFIGLASFAVPFVLGYFVCSTFLGLSDNASLLIGAMLSSHTLISYPLLGRLGIVNKSIVTIVVGATIIADILALVAMELITNFAEEGFDMGSLIVLGIDFFLFLFIVFMVVPRISRIFLSKYEGDLGVQYIFVLVMLFISATIAYILKIEPIIGAFFSGLVLNRQIINSSPLYRRIEFIGNNMFIPFFLISISMLANFKVYLDHPGEIGLALILIATAILGKFLAAFISKEFFRLSVSEGNLIFGLSVSRAASAIAIILIGYNTGIVNESVLNGTVILILTTCIASSYITRYAGKKILLKENETLTRNIGIRHKFLVPVANPANMENLLEFAVLIKDKNDSVPVYPLTVFTSGNQVREKIDENQAAIQKVIESLHTDVIFETSSRIDNNVTNGIVRAAEELVATAIILGWNNHTIPFHILFGNVLDNLLEKTERMIVVLKTPTSFREVRKISLFCPENAQFENGFSLWLGTLTTLAERLKLKIKINCDSALTNEAIKSYIVKNNSIKYFSFHKSSFKHLSDNLIKHTSSELLLFVHSRKKAISYHRSFEHFMNSSISMFKKNNVVIIYPEQ